MKRFRFRLQRLLEIREHKEKQVKNELAGAEGKKYIHVEKKEKILKEDQGSRKNMHLEQEKRKLTIDRFHQYQRYFNRLKANVTARDKLISLIDDEIKVINERLVEARREKRVLERLKENKLKEYQYEMQREDQNFFDEVGNNKFIKSKIEEKGRKKAEVKEKVGIPIKYKEIEKGPTEQLYEEIVEKGELF